MICPLDGQVVVETQESRTNNTPVQPDAVTTSFNVKLISPISSAGTYRVFIERNDLLFIQIEGGSKSVLAALAPLLGPAGGLIPLALWLFTKKQTNARFQNLDQQDPEDLLRENESSFKLHLAEIRDAAIEPTTFLATSGKAGRLILTVRHGEKIKFEFEKAGEMANAIRLLTPLLNSTIRINVEWNGQKKRFEKVSLAA
jgi:hypothetical protein